MKNRFDRETGMPIFEAYFRLRGRLPKEGEKVGIVHRTRENFNYSFIRGEINCSEAIIISDEYKLNKRLLEDSQYWMTEERNAEIYLAIEGFEAVLMAAEDKKECFYIRDNKSKKFICFDNDNKKFIWNDTPSDLFLYSMQSITATSIAKAKAPEGVTYHQPFPTGTAGSNNFRCPCLASFSNGSIAAVADVRWNHDRDGRAIDIIFSITEDYGKSWRYCTPVYHNDSIDPKCSNPEKEYCQFDYKPFDYAQTTIDPVIAIDNNDRIYIIADRFPGGAATEGIMPMKPQSATGYFMIEGKERMVLYRDAEDYLQNDNNYTHFVGDYEEDGFAPVFERNGTHEPVCYIDKGFYLYDSRKKPKYCLQIEGNGAAVIQNIFFYNADMHVRCATYLVMVTSDDYGRTWSDPMLINPMVFRDENKIFYGTGPGAGTLLKDGTVVIPMYSHVPENASFIYTRNGGSTWERSMDSTAEGVWSSESDFVQLSPEKMRQFMRTHERVLTFVDWNLSNGEWITDQKIMQTGEWVKDNVMVSACGISKTNKGRQVILVSAPTTGHEIDSRIKDARADGRIYTYAVNEDFSMELLSEFDVWPSGGSFPHGDYYENGMECYTYSCIRELKNGKIGLLVETHFAPAKITYRAMELAECCPGVEFDIE